jgi:ribonuclease-3
MLPENIARRLNLPEDLPHLEEALTHPSYSNEQRRGARVDNQRLEFLGDAVLGLCVSQLLMSRFPMADEGELSLMRAALVNTEALASWARAVDLGRALRLGRGADAAGERDQTNVLADAVEAVVGAVYIDLGLERARAFTEAIVAEPLARAEREGGSGRDAKSELQERVQAAGEPSPRYRVVAAEGPDHQREFVVAVEVAGQVVSEGRGRSKKLAEQAAARAALSTGGFAPVSSRRGEAAGAASEPVSSASGGAPGVSSAPPEDGGPENASSTTGTSGESQ